MKYLHDNDETSIVSYPTMNTIHSDLCDKKNINTSERIPDKQTDDICDKLCIGDKRYSRYNKKSNFIRISAFIFKFVRILISLTPLN